MTRTEAKANYKAAERAYNAFSPTKQKARAAFLAGIIEYEEYEAVKAHYDELAERFDEAFAATKEAAVQLEFAF